MAQHNGGPPHHIQWHTLPSGFDVGVGGPRQADTTRQLLLGDATFPASTLQAQTHLAVESGSIKPHAQPLVSDRNILIQTPPDVYGLDINVHLMHNCWPNNQSYREFTMLTKTDLATSTVIEGWLRDLALTPIQRPDAVNNWNLEFTVQGSPAFAMNVVNPKSFPRAIMLICGMTPVAEQVAAFQRLDQAHRIAFWKDLRTLLSRESVEFHLEGVGVMECPKAVRVTAMRFDDGLCLDSFARTLSSVCKACGDIVVLFTERLGELSAPAGGEFAFKKSATQ
jgi:hypothetical protein